MRARLEPHPRFPVYLYQRILEKYVSVLAEIAPLPTISLLGEVLNEGITLGVRDLDKANGQDWSSIWYPMLDSPSHRMDSDAKAALTAALVRLIDELAAKNAASYPTLQRILASYRWHIFDRMRMRLADRYSEVSREQLCTFILQMPNVEGADFNEEYFHLVNKHFGLLTNEEKRGVVRRLFEGPDVQTHLQQAFGGPPSPEQIKRYVRRWKFMHLYPIRAHLVSEEAEEYARISEGQSEPRYRAFFHSEGHGPH